jgi:signal transduction histidine kinase
VLNRVERVRDQTLQLRAGSVVFDAHLDAPAGPQHRLASIPEGSRVRVTGVCLVPANLQLLAPNPQPFSLLLRSAGDVKVLKRPSWWTVRHSLWVLGVMLAVFCSSLVWVAVLRNRVRAQTQIIREKAQREAALEERTRIARDLHDELGASLTQIALLSDRPQTAAPAELSENLRKVSVTTQEMAQSLDEIVWAVNPKHDSLEGLVGYLTQYTEQFFEDTAIRCRLEMPVSSRSFALPAEVRHDLFLVVKEALNNVLKHSGASEVLVEVSARGESVQIVIDDNGRGFGTGAARPGRNGNGLDNMRRRMENNGGQLEVSSTRGHGTRLKLNLRVKQGGAVD